MAQTQLHTGAQAFQALGGAAGATLASDADSPVEVVNGCPFHYHLLKGDSVHISVLCLAQRPENVTTLKTRKRCPCPKHRSDFSAIFLQQTPRLCTLRFEIKGRWTGGFQTGGFPDLDLSFLFCPFLSFFGLSRFFRDFPDLRGDGPGIFPICPFPLSRPIKSTATRGTVRKGPRHNLDLSRKKCETPGFGNTPV